MRTTAFKNEDELIRAFHEQKPGAVRYLFDSLYRTLVMYADRMINDTGEAEDIVLFAFNKLVEKRENFSELRGIEGFLYVVVRNESIDFIRNSRKKRATKKELFYLSTDIHDEEKQFDLIRLQTEVLKTLYDEINKLPERAREIMLLSVVDRFRNEEIARKMKIEVQTVKNQKTKAIGQLRTAFLEKKLLHTTVLILVYRALCFLIP